MTIAQGVLEEDPEALAKAEPEPERPDDPLPGLLFAEPRVAVPLGRPILIPSGCTADIEFCPQRPIAGPFWLGLTNADLVSVRHFTIGHDQIFMSYGEVPGEWFDVRDPAALIALDAPLLNLGNVVRLTLRNRSLCNIEVQATLWGSPLETDCFGNVRLPDVVQGHSAPRQFVERVTDQLRERREQSKLAELESALADLQSELGELRAELLSRTAPPPPSAADGAHAAFRARVQADNAATAEHVIKRLEAAYEPEGAAWATPAWED